MAQDNFNDEQPQSDDAGSEANQPIPVIVNRRKTNFNPANKTQNKSNLKSIKRSNKLLQALDLPSVMNVNPRSVYNNCRGRKPDYSEKVDSQRSTNQSRKNMTKKFLKQRRGSKPIVLMML
jgi:hypothetical protein